MGPACDVTEAWQRGPVSVWSRHEREEPATPGIGFQHPLRRTTVDAAGTLPGKPGQSVHRAHSNAPRCGFYIWGLTSGFVPYADTVSIFSLSGSQMGFRKPLVWQASIIKAEPASFKIEISFQIHRILIQI